MLRPEWYKSTREDLCLFSLTSGSTGRSKIVMLKHRNLIARSLGSNQLNKFTSEDTVLNFIPMTHVGAIIMCHTRYFTNSITTG